MTTRNQKNELFTAKNTERGQSRAAVTKESNPERYITRLKEADSQEVHFVMMLLPFMD